MNDSKLVQVLKKLTKEEFRGFKKNLNELAIGDKVKIKNSLTLFNLLSPYYPVFNKNDVSKCEVFAKLYPEEPYKTGKLEKQMSYLFGLLQEFIVSEKNGDQLALHQLLILYTFYCNRGLDNLAAIQIRKYQKSISKTSNNDATFFYDTFLLEKEVSNQQAIFLDRKETSSFSNALEHLDLYYILEKLELACRLLAIHRFVFPVDLEKSLVLLDHLRPLLDEEYFEEPLIKVYYKAYCFLSADTDDEIESAFKLFEESLELYQPSISEKQSLPLHTIVRNYCVIQYHRGVKNYLRKGFEVYKDHLSKGYLYMNDQLFAGTLANIAGYGLKLREYDWVFNFINDHKDKIIGTNAAEVYHLNIADYYFHTRDYEKALDYLRKPYEDTYFKLKAKRLEIKIYYELKHVLLGPKIDAFKIYIYRFPSEKITQKQKMANRNFIDLLKQIQLPRTFQNEKRIDKLIDKVYSFPSLHDREWLVEILENLR